MSKSSKSCGYTGHMRIMNKENPTKNMYQSKQAKSHNCNDAVAGGHTHCKAVYPEVQAEVNAQQKCGCRK